MLQASTALRRAFYEFFLHFHILLVIMTLVALWHHLDDLSQKNYIAVVIAAWATEVRYFPPSCSTDTDIFSVVFA